MDAQPLSLTNMNISGATRNVLYVATEHDTVYAFDADSGTILWQMSMLGSGETTSDDHGCGQVTPEIGITSTPVIDKSSGTIYVVAMSKNGSGSYMQRLHALDVTSGAEKFGGPVTIQASYPGTGDNSSGGNVIFDPGQYEERAGLLIAEWDHLHDLDVALRCPPLYGVGHGVQRVDSCANERAQPDAEWQRRRDLDGGNRSGG